MSEPKILYGHVEQLTTGGRMTHESALTTAASSPPRTECLALSVVMEAIDSRISRATKVKEIAKRMRTIKEMTAVIEWLVELRSDIAERGVQ